MRPNSRISLLILLFTACVCSRSVFALFDDPEGPNLLIVTVLAALLFGVSAVAYLSPVLPSLIGARRTVAAIFVQILVAVGLYFAGR